MSPSSIFVTAVFFTWMVVVHVDVVTDNRCWNSAYSSQLSTASLSEPAQLYSMHSFALVCYIVALFSALICILYTSIRGHFCPLVVCIIKKELSVHVCLMICSLFIDDLSFVYCRQA